MHKRDKQTSPRDKTRGVRLKHPLYQKLQTSVFSATNTILSQYASRRAFCPLKYSPGQSSESKQTGELLATKLWETNQYPR